MEKNCQEGKCDKKNRTFFKKNSLKSTYKKHFF